MSEAPTVSLRALVRVLVTLKPTRLAYLVRGLLKLPPAQNDDLWLSTQLKLALADWLTHLGCISDQQQVQILTHFGTQLDEMAGDFRRVMRVGGQRAEWPIFTLTIGDSRYVHTSRSVSWFDLQTEEEPTNLPEPCVTSIVCNVTALYWKLLARLRQSGGIKDDPISPGKP